MSRRVRGIKESIQNSYDQLRAVLDHYKVTLEEKANAVGKCREDAVIVQIEQLKLAQSEIQGLVEFVEQSIVNTSDTNLINIQPQLQIKMEEGEGWHAKASELLQPKTTAYDIYYVAPVNDVPLDLGALFTRSTASRSVSSIVGLEEVCLIGEANQFHVKRLLILWIAM